MRDVTGLDNVVVHPFPFRGRHKTYYLRLELPKLKNDIYLELGVT